MANRNDPLKTLLTAIRQKRADDYKFGARQLRDQFNSKRRRTAASQRQLHKMWQTGLEAAGVNTEKLDQLHEKDSRSAAEFADKQLADARQEVRRIAKRRRGKVRQARRLKRLFEYEKGNPALLVCLWEAASIQVERVLSQGDSVLVDDGGVIEHGRNNVRVFLQCDESQFLYATVNHDFVWTPSRTGLLTANAWLNLNGVFDLRADGHCDLLSTHATLVVRVTLTLSQRAADRADLLQVAMPFDVLVDETVEAGCVTDAKTGLLLQVDELLLSNATPFPVEEDPDRPFAATVTTEFIMWGLGVSSALVRVDLNDSAAFGADVPSVWLNVES